MTEFNVSPTVAPREEQYRIFDAASQAWALLFTNLDREQCLAAIATMAAMDIGVKLFGPEDEAEAFAYLDRTVREMLPIVRQLSRNARGTE